MASLERLRNAVRLEFWAPRITDTGGRMKRFSLIALALFAIAAGARADERMDAAVAGLSSKDRSVRQASLKAIRAWEKELFEPINALNHQNDADVSQLRAQLAKLQEAVEVWKRYKDVVGCGDLLETVVEAAADPSPKPARDFFADVLGITDVEQPDLDQDESIRGYCGTGEIDVRTAIRYVVSRRPQVVRQLLNDPRVAFRSQLLLPLAQLGHSQDRSLVFRFLGASKPVLRSAAVEAVREYPVALWQRPVLSMASDRNGYVRDSVAYALGNVDPKVARPALLRLLDDRCRTVAERAYLSLDEDHSPGLGKIFLRMFLRHPSWADFAISGLTDNPIREAGPVAVAHWKSKSEGWEEVPKLLIAIDLSQGRKFLVSAARDHDVERRRVAVARLADVKGDDAEEALIAALRDPDSEVVDLACEAIAERKLVDAIPVLREMLRAKRGDPERVEKAFRACAGVGIRESQ